MCTLILVAQTFFPNCYWSLIDPLLKRLKCKEQNPQSSICWKINSAEVNLRLQRSELDKSNVLEDSFPVFLHHSVSLLSCGEGRITHRVNFQLNEW